MKYINYGKLCFLIIFFLLQTQILSHPNSPIDAIDNQALASFAAKAYSRFSTICNTFNLATDCVINNIEGDFVECGVAAGAQIAAMAYACHRLDSSKNLHLFDSFEGIPLAGPQDDSQPGIGAITHNVHVENLDELLVTSGVSAWSQQVVENNMREWNINPSHLVYHKGWFQHILPLLTGLDKICLLRLDGDLYESTKVCLEYLYPKVSSGGYVIIDDYALAGCKKAVDEYLENYNIKVTIQEVENGGGPVYWLVP